MPFDNDDTDEDHAVRIALPNGQSEVDDITQFVNTAPVDGPAGEEPLPSVQLAMLEELNNLDSYDYDTSLADPFHPQPTI